MNRSQPDPDMGNKCPQCGASLPTGALEGFCPACLLKQGAAAETAMPPGIASFQPPSVLEMARMFPQLEILGFIGKGGMGAVYKARQPALDRLVALKILPPQVASGPGFAERFNREARALARLSHPNIIGVHEFGQVQGLPFFIMEFVDGLNLRQLERAGRLSSREALHIVPQICDALQFAHDEGIVHRDIKPENILLDKKGRVKIADFGIAKIMGSEAEMGITETREAIGTPQYMAPEQAERPETVDHRADIFSLGVVFYEMLTGELPLGKFAPPSRTVEVDVRLDAVVLRALEKEPDRRYQYASQVRTAVDSIASTPAPPPPLDAGALARELPTRDYVLDIGSCLRRGWKLVRSGFWPIVGVSALLVLSLAALFQRARSRAAAAEAMAAQEASSYAAQLSSGFVFGPVIERVFEFTNSTRRALNLASGNFVAFPPGRVVLDIGPDGTNRSGAAEADLVLSDTALESVNDRAGSVSKAVPELEALDWRALNPIPAGELEGRTEADLASADSLEFLRQVTAREPGDPAQGEQTIRGTNPFHFVTRDGAEGVLRIEGLAEEPRGVKVHYRLLLPAPGGEPGLRSRERLAERAEAADGIRGNEERSRAFAKLATDAASAGEVGLVSSSLQRITDNQTRDQAALDSARLLAQRHLRRQAVEVARRILGNELRDQALSELAQ
jgi:serine/threonine protein kinase